MVKKTTKQSGPVKKGYPVRLDKVWCWNPLVDKETLEEKKQQILSEARRYLRRRLREIEAEIANARAHTHR